VITTGAAGFSKGPGEEENFKTKIFFADDNFK